jgi:hypothetical protein
VIPLAEVIVLGLAGHRLWRLAAVDEMPWLERARDWVTGTHSVVMYKGMPGHETTVEHTRRPTLKKLIDCPWCLGSYLTVALLAAYAEWPWGARWIVGALAVGEVIGLIGRNLDPVED